MNYTQNKETNFLNIIENLEREDVIFIKGKPFIVYPASNSDIERVIGVKEVNHAD